MAKNATVNEDSLLAELEDEDALLSHLEDDGPDEPVGITKAFFPSASQPQPDSQTVRIPKRIGNTMAFDPMNYEEKTVPVSNTEKIGRRIVTGIAQDIPTLPTRFAGSLASQAGYKASTGGKDLSFREGLADPETSIMRQPKEIFASIIAQDFKDLKSKDRALLEKAGDAFTMALAGAGYLVSSVVEGPEGLVAAGLKVAATGAKVAAKAVKPTLAKLSGKPAEALERAAQVPMKEIEAAAGTERAIADDMVSGVEKAGESISEKSGLAGQARKIESQTALRVPVEPSKNAVQTKLPSYSIDPSGNLVKSPDAAAYPVSQFQGKLKDKKWEVKAQKTLDAITDQFNFFNSKLAGKKTVTASEMRTITKQWQKASKYNDVDDTEYNDFMKALAASGRMALEDAVVRSGMGKEYVTLMREIATKADALDEIGKKVLGRDPRDFAAKAEREISGVGFRKNVDDLERLKNLDKIIEDATGVKSDLAGRAMNAFTAKQLGVEPGKSISWVNDIGNGRSVLGALMGGAVGTMMGLKTGGAGILLGVVATSPKASVLTYRALNMTEAMDKSARVKSLVSAMAKTSSATTLAKLTTQLDKEMDRLKQEDAGSEPAPSPIKK